MASKFGLAGGIPERRVRPVWDAIDSRQFKNALKFATSLLSKYPNSPYALALKALVLERMGKMDEALSVCLDAKTLLYKDDSLLMDDLTLSTLQIVFQRLGHLELATSCYEHACGKFPNNLDLMMGLFNCYVREYSFVKQQQTAIKMYKLGGEERFLLWAVCSIQLQVLCDNGGEKLLLLAEGLLKKHIASHGLHEPEALLVYISILERQSKYKDALEILSGDLGSLLVIEVDKLRIQGRLLARAGDYAAGADINKRILELSPDDWEGFLHYIGCLLKDDSIWLYSNSIDQVHPPKFVDCKFSQLTDEMFDTQISSALDLVQRLQADANNDSLRGPCLAKLEIERRKILYGKDNENQLIESLLQYFLKFGHLSCFASDVEGFLQVLSPDKKIEFVEKFNKCEESLPVSPTKVIGQLITIFKIQETTGRIYELPVGDLEGVAVKMAKLYCENLPLSKDLDPQESIYGEELLSVICSILVQLFWRTKHFGYLIEAIMVLEFGSTIRRFVWQYKILLLHLYSHIGALPLAYERYKALDVKNILTETVSHHILHQMLESSMWTDLNSLLKDYCKFMDDHLRESADLTFLAYRHRNYSKVIEFVQFKERLQHSSQYLVARVEAPVLQLKQNADNIEEQERVLGDLKCGVHFVELSNEIGSKSLTFNEDLHTRPWWTPTPEKNYLLGPFEGISYYPRENLAKEREANVQRAIQGKSLIPRMIYLSIQNASMAFKENVKANGSSSDPDVSAELKLLLERLAKLLGFSLSDAIEVISDVSSGVKPYEAFGSDIVDWLNLAVFWNSWSLNSSEHGNSSWHVVNSLLEKVILNQITSIQSVIGSHQSSLASVVKVVTEPLAWHSLVIQAFVRSSLPSGKKKKRNTPIDHSSSPVYQSVKDSVNSLCSIVHEVEKWLSNQLNRPDEEYVSTFVCSIKRDEQEGGPGQVLEILESLVMSVNESEHGDRIFKALKSWSCPDIARNLVTGQKKAVSEFLRICESKIKLLEGLKLQMLNV